MKVKILKLLSL